MAPEELPLPAAWPRDPGGTALRPALRGGALHDAARRDAAPEALPRPPSRAALLRRDPLSLIPACRLAAAAAPAAEPEAGPVEIPADDPAFCGQGWWPAERTPEGPLRWSGAAPCAAMLVPALGGGRLRLTLRLRSPFGIPLGLDGHGWFLDGAPLRLAALDGGAVTGRFAAEALLPPMPPLARLSLLLHGARHADPEPGPRRDGRRLGLGLVALRRERA